MHLSYAPLWTEKGVNNESVIRKKNYTYSDPELCFRHVWNDEVKDSLQQDQGHVCHDAHVTLPVRHGNSRDHHISVSNGLHLKEKRDRVSLLKNVFLPVCTSENTRITIPFKLILHQVWPLLQYLTNLRYYALPDLLGVPDAYMCVLIALQCWSGISVLMWKMYMCMYTCSVCVKTIHVWVCAFA